MLALGRQVAPVAPKRRPHPLGIVGRTEGLDADMARVEPLEQAMDHRTFAGTVHARHQDHDRERLLLDQRRLSLEQGGTE